MEVVFRFDDVSVGFEVWNKFATDGFGVRHNNVQSIYLLGKKRRF